MTGFASCHCLAKSFFLISHKEKYKEVTVALQVLPSLAWSVSLLSSRTHSQVQAGEVSRLFQYLHDTWDILVSPASFPFIISAEDGTAVSATSLILLDIKIISSDCDISFGEDVCN